MKMIQLSVLVFNSFKTVCGDKGISLDVKEQLLSTCVFAIIL